MWYCRTCATNNEDESKFCVMCGARRWTEDTEETVCAGFSTEQQEYTQPWSVQDNRQNPPKKTGKKGLWLIPVACVVVLVGVLLGVLLRFHGDDGSRWVSLGSTHFDQEGKLNGFRQEDGELFCFEDGKVLQGWKRVDGWRYYFGEDGAAVTGWETIDNHRYYFEENGAAASGMVTLDGQTYYFEDGQPSSGLKLLNNRYYLFGDDGKTITGWQDIGSDTYYFDTDGAAVTGWQNVSGADYYFNFDGKLANGWTDIGGQQLYLIHGALAQGWKDVAGGRYYFNDGVYATGFLQDGEEWYYLKDDGKMATGLTQIKGNWYGFDSNGLMLTDQELTQDGKTYAFRWDGIATHYTYRINNLASTESEELYSFDMNNGNTWEASYYALAEPIRDCSELTFHFEIAEVVKGSSKGEWGMYAWTTDGEWELICEFKCTVKSVEIKQTFDNPISFYGYSFVLMDPYSSGDISVRLSHYLYDVFAVEKLN